MAAGRYPVHLVTFEVIPAIDVADGRLARVTPGGSDPVDAFDGDPRQAARAYVDAGARWLHVVDLDLARTGEPGNLDVISDIGALGVPVQASGGVSSPSHVEALLSVGAARVVLGSVALGDRGVTEGLIGSMGDRLVVGIEADGPKIVPRGRDARELVLWDTLEWLGELDVQRFLFTEVGRVGGLGGPDLDGVWALATHMGQPVIASGGIRGIEDLCALADLGGSVEGAIVGRAFLEGELDVASTISAFA
jgi:phosphoribosylformimino-5-aminoimidazole carboxamide ribonucleotide (ProFAR) isomerase